MVVRTLCAGGKMRLDGLLKEPRKNDFFGRFIDPSFDPFFQFDPFLTHKKRVKLRQTTSNPAKGKSPGTRMIPGLFGVFSACRTENLPEKEKWNRADFAFSARFPRQKRHFQAENVQKIHVPEHHTILRFAAYLFLAQGSPGLRTTTGAANLEATKPYYNGGIQNGQVHF